jgi:hypothetical protein
MVAELYARAKYVPLAKTVFAVAPGLAVLVPVADVCQYQVTFAAGEPVRVKALPKRQEGVPAA